MEVTGFLWGACIFARIFLKRFCAEEITFGKIPVKYFAEHMVSFRNFFTGIFLIVLNFFSMNMMCQNNLRTRDWVF